MKKKEGKPTTPKRKIEDIGNKDELIFGKLETPKKKLRLDEEKLVEGNGNHYLKGKKNFFEGRVKRIAGKFELIGKEYNEKESNSKTIEILDLRSVIKKSPRKRRKRSDVFTQKEMKNVNYFHLMKSLVMMKKKRVFI